MTLPANGNAPLNSPSHYTEHVGLPRGIVAYKNSGPGPTMALSAAAIEVMRLTAVPLSAGRMYTFNAGVRAFTLTANGHVAFRSTT